MAPPAEPQTSQYLSTRFSGSMKPRGISSGSVVAKPGCDCMGAGADRTLDDGHVHGRGKEADDRVRLRDERRHVVPLTGGAGEYSVIRGSCTIAPQPPTIRVYMLCLIYVYHT